MKRTPTMQKCIDGLAKTMFGPTEPGHCVVCKAEMKLDSFRDKLSLSEYNISGFCQSCQDKTFKVPRLLQGEQKMSKAKRFLFGNMLVDIDTLRGIVDMEKTANSDEEVLLALAEKGHEVIRLGIYYVADPSTKKCWICHNHYGADTNAIADAMCPRYGYVCEDHFNRLAINKESATILAQREHVPESPPNGNAEGSESHTPDYANYVLSCGLRNILCPSCGHDHKLEAEFDGSFDCHKCSMNFMVVPVTELLTSCRP